MVFLLCWWWCFCYVGVVVSVMLVVLFLLCCWWCFCYVGGVSVIIVSGAVFAFATVAVIFAVVAPTAVVNNFLDL